MGQEKLLDLRRTITFLVVLCLEVFVLPLVLPFILLFCMYRVFVQIFARIFRKDLLTHVRGPSIPMALEHLTVKNSKYNVIVVAILEGNLSLEEVLKIVEKRARELRKPNGEPIYGELHQYWENFMGYLFWKWDAKFDLKNHIRNYQEDNLRASQPLYEKDLAGIFSELMPKKWVEGQSPWEALRISNYFPKGKNEPHMAFVIRFHHALGDGFSFKKLFEDFGGVNFKTPQMSVKADKWWKKILIGVVQLVRFLYDGANFITNTIDWDHSLHQSSGKLSREFNYCIMEEEISTNRVKDVALNFNVNYTAVLYAVMTGGIRRVLETANLEIPHKIACMLPLPLPFRPEGLVNHMWVYAITLPIGVKSPKERLQIINDQFKDILFNGTWLVYVLSYKIMFVLPSPVISFFVNRIQATMVSSVFPGPELQVGDYLGNKLVDVFFHLGSPSGKMGLSGCTMSAMGRQHFIYMVDKTISPPVEIFNNIGTYTAQELDTLYNSSQGEINPAFIV